jgi:hypothetical protein
MTALRFWELVCDAPVKRGGLDDVCGVGEMGADPYLKETRRFLRGLGWTRGPNGEDYCPEHSGGRPCQEATP